MKMVCKVIFKSDYSDWILNKHYAKRMPSISQAYGAYVDGILLGIITFGVPASPNLCEGVCGMEYKDHVWELNRLCVEKNDFFKTSEFVGVALRRLSQLFSTGKVGQSGRIIVSYADTAMGHVGKIYQATNFFYTGCTKERTDMSAGDGKHSRHGTDTSIRQIRSAKHRYIAFVGNRGFKRYAKRALKYEILPYPKGETRQYNADYIPSSQTIFQI